MIKKAGHRRTSEGPQVARAVARAQRQAGTEKGTLGVFAMALFAAFVALDLVAILMGTTSYRSVHQLRTQDQAAARTLGPLVSTVRAADAAGALTTGTGPEGRALVVVEALESGTYETRIYLHQGALVEEYALAGAPYAPEAATPLAQTSFFDFAYEGGLLSVRTDQGSVSVALRSALGTDGGAA